MPKNAKSFNQNSLDKFKRENKKPKPGGVLHTGVVTREAGEEYGGGDAWTGSGTSIFDPVLSEMAYRWFSPPDSVVLDPFSGGSVRGIVASKLGREYHGCDLSGRQVAANRVQGAKICAGDRCPPQWYHGNSLYIERVIPDVQADFIFSCPPYHSLEVYSDSKDDLSNMSYEEFHDVYRQIIAASVRMLKPNRFAAFVVGDVRDKEGNYRNFPGHTVQGFIDAGCHLYNEAILVTSVGSLPIRVGKQFKAGRKLGKTHQQIYIFIKGDSKKAAALIED
jgi:DNA modification methylase